MDIQRWIARRESNWTQLDQLLRQVEKQGIEDLSAHQIKQMASLYRSVSADLARAQTYQVSQILIQDLQSLTSRAFSQIYQGSRHQEWRSIGWFYRWGWPRVVQQTWAYQGVALALFMVGFSVGWWYSWADPDFILTMIPEDLLETVQRGELWVGSIVGTEPTSSSGILVNNLRVAFTALGGGVTLGLLTIWILCLNGLLIGVVSVLVAKYNLSGPFWGFVLPHGSLELPAIFLAGAAGLLIGRGLVFPGYRRRAEAVRYYGGLAAQLMYGVVPLLLVAAAIEGFFSPNPGVPDPLKYAVGILLFLGLVMYANSRRDQDPTTYG